jgi:hypothetical protein
LYPEGNYTYTVFRTNAPTLTFASPLNCYTWSTEDDFWDFSQIVWNVCAIESEIVDRGQAFLYANVPCEREIEFVAYPLGNNIMEAVVYVANTPLYQFPCTIKTNTTFVVDKDIVTYCPVITIEDGGALQSNTPFTLTQTIAPYGYC